MKNLPRKIILGSLIPTCILLAWGFSVSGNSGWSVIPGIDEVLKIVIAPWEKPASLAAPPLLFSLQTSLLRVLIGFFFAVIFGVPMGLLMGRSRTAQEILGPFAGMMRVVCPIAWIPVAIVVVGMTPISDTLFGVGDGWRYARLYELQPAMLLIVGSGAFFPILLSSADGARSVRKSLAESMALMGASPWQRFRHLIFPHALPQIVGGMRIGLGISWMVIIAAELYPGTRSGLGYTIEESQVDNLQYEYAFAAIFYIMAVGLIMSGALWLLQKKASHWQAEQR